MTNETNTALVIYQDLSTKLDSIFGILAEKLGTGIEHFWPLFIKQQFIIGLRTAIFFCIAWIFTIVYTATFKRVWAAANDHDDIPAQIWLLVGGITAALGCVIGTIEFTTIGVTSLFNPEYMALQEVIKMVK